MIETIPPCGWMIEDLGAAAADPHEVTAFASRFGNVSDRDGGPAWRIAPRRSSGTFSETAAAAPLHTDAQYRDEPEDAFVLACVRQARAGGDNVLLTVADLVAALTDRADWPELEPVLTMPIWRWRTPAVFGAPRFNTPTAVLSRRDDGSPVMRWRHDNLIHDDRYAWAADIVAAVAEAHPSSRVLRLEAGHVLVCDNATVLHGRTAFSDTERMLWRVRVHR